MTPAEFLTAFPSFSNERTVDIQRQIDASPPFFGERWGALYAVGLGNFIAHMLIAEKKGFNALAGDAVSKSVGGASISRSSERITEQARDPFQTTGYGRMYRRLALMVGMGPVVV